MRVAGVDKEQNRIIAATYDLENNNRLIELNISLPARESLSINNDDYLNSFLINKFWVTIPTNKNNPYLTAGLITQAMCDKTGSLDRSLPEFSNKALSIQLVNPNKPIIGKPETSFDFESLNYAFKQMGYSIYRKDGMINVGICNADAERKHLKPWEISVPEFLPKI